MKFTEHIVTKLLSTEYEKFTSYCITAVSIAKSDVAFNKKDKEKIQWIINNTNEILQTSIYKLDRFVDPTQYNNNPTNYSYGITFQSDYITDQFGDFKTFKIKSEVIQKYLCEAVQEINELMYKNMKAYNEDFVMPEAINGDDEF